jgi:hypothetical protein
LTVSLHIKRLKGRIPRIAGLFRRLKDILSFPVKRMLFFALFLSQVSYGISVWGRTYHYLINGIQRVQNRAIKNLFGFPFLEETYDVHNRCAIFPIALLHFDKFTILLHNVYKSFTLSNISLRENFQFHYHNLRNGTDIRNETGNSTGLGTVPLLYPYVTN